MKVVLVSLSLFLVMFSCDLLADDIINVHIEGSSRLADRGKAVREMTSKAIEGVTLKYVNDLIGETKALKNVNLVKTKIIHNSSRYVLLMKNSRVKRSGSEYQMFFDMKISIVNLRKMLLSEGLLYREDGPPEVLPLITITDKVGAQSYSWWTQTANQSTAYVKNLSSIVHKQLKHDLYSRGFFGFTPVKFNMHTLIPEIFRSTGLRREDYLNMGYIIGGSVVVLGDLKISKVKNMVETYKIDVALEAVHTGSGRIVGEVIRSYQTSMGSYKGVVKKKLVQEVSKFTRDLTVQLKDAWKKGIFDASLLKVSFVGKRLSYTQLESLKKEMVAFRFVKSMRERFFGNDRVIFELDSNLSVDELAKKLAGKSVAGLKLGVGEIQNYGLTLTVK